MISCLCFKQLCNSGPGSHFISTSRLIAPIHRTAGRSSEKMPTTWLAPGGQVSSMSCCFSLAWCLALSALFSVCKAAPSGLCDNLLTDIERTPRV